ncbi:MAG: hypothetical protein QM493_11340 [Sulfurovum sp.]
MAKVNNILFIVEGKKTEPLIMENLKKFFLNDNNEYIATKDIIVSYGTVIYGLYKKFLDKNGELDFDIDTFAILKRLDDRLKDIKRKEIDQIYLIFDYDSHASNADYNKLLKVLNLFDNELDKGKLFISYPMVEALRHLKDEVDFKDTKVISEKAYKNISKECDACFLHFNDYTQENWKTIISQHYQKANFIVNDKFEFPPNIIEQLDILVKQKEKYIDIEEKVAVLSAFPLFLVDYYGTKRFNP